MADFYSFIKTLINKEKIQKVINRKTETIEKAFEGNSLNPHRIISLEWHPSLVDFATNGLDVSYVSNDQNAHEYAAALCAEYNVSITTYDMPLNAFAIKFHMDGIEAYDCVLALDQYYTFYGSEDKQRNALGHSLDLLKEDGILLTTLMDYKNIKYNSKVFSEPFYMRNDNEEFIFISNRKWNQDDRKKWIHYTYAINQTTNELHAFTPSNRQAMFFKQLAYHSASLGWNNFVVHKKLIYKRMYSNESEYIISITR
jgi:hypothetical protein